jgi:hypothetical protein
MGGRVALLLCLIAVSGAAAATQATTAESTVTFLPPPDKVDLLKAVTDPQLEGEKCCTRSGVKMMATAAKCCTMVLLVTLVVLLLYQSLKTWQSTTFAGY